MKLFIEKINKLNKKKVSEKNIIKSKLGILFIF